MKKCGTFIISVVCIIVIVLFVIKQKNSSDSIVYVDYDANNNSIIKSETTYISDSSHKFKICQSRDGNMPCKEILGIKHGIQKWYNGNNVLKYEDFYNHGNLTHTIAYYNNGLKYKEYVYQNNKLLKINMYSKDNTNSLAETIFYRDNEKIKKYYVNNRICKEEKYRNNRLVSRKIYDRDGLLQRLEEYNFVGNDIEFDNLFEEFDLSPFLFKFENPNDKQQQYNNNANDNIWI